jgi:hypothetical protein
MKIDVKKIARSGGPLTLAWAVVLIFAAGGGAAESGSQPMNEALLNLDQAPLSQEAKLEVRSLADRAVKAGIPADDVAVIISRSLRRGADGGQIAGFLKTAVMVKERHLPASLILDRTEQGLSKGVPVGRIGTVVQGLAEKLSRAQPIVSSLRQAGLKPGRNTGEDDAIETVARAMEKSIPEAVILKTGDRVMGREGSLARFDTAVDTMTFLAGNGMPVEKASRLVGSALDAGHPEKEMEKMEKTVIEGLQKGRSMNDMSTDMESHMEREDMRDRGRPDNESMRGPGAGMGGPRR